MSYHCYNLQLALEVGLSANQMVSFSLLLKEHILALQIILQLVDVEQVGLVISQLTSEKDNEGVACP
jgi:hypothetical protein